METENRYNEWLSGVRYLVYQRRVMPQTKLAKESSAAREHINAVLRGRTNAGPDLQDAISRALGMSYDEVRSLGREVFGGLTAPYRGDDAPAPSLPGDTDFIPVPKAATKLSAGGGFHVEDGVAGHYHFRADLLRRLCNPAHAVLVDCVGDSMEPTIRDGETLLIDLSATEIRDGGIYALGTDDVALVKRLRRTPEGLVRVISDNAAASPEGPPARPDEIRVLGRVVWHGGEVK